MVLNRQHYILEAHRQLSIKEHYKKLHLDPTKEFKIEYDQMLHLWKNNELIDEDEFRYLTVGHPVTRTIYFLPKIHKSMTNPPGRPIVSSIGSLLENTSRFSDTFLHQYVTALPSYLRDTTDFLNRINGIPWQNGYLMATVDVVSLYTSINHDQGVHAAKHFLRTRPISLLEHIRIC